MPIVLSSAEHSFREPKRKNRWILKFDNVPLAAATATEALAIDIVSASRPSISFESYTVNRLNEQFHFAGKPTWEAMNCTFYDYDKGANSAAQILYAWATAIYNPLTGGQGYAVVYKTNATLVMLGPDGTIIEVWDLFGVYPENINWQDLSYDGSEGTQVEATIKFDYAVMQADSGPGGIPGS